ncbi:c-type cytochrome [Deinococcus radiopugnans]|uniref:c-type cytochrome n=1 Tax=Deinococcus radiopugnans TaxID=57497 RepID=UPI00068C8C3F|nr:cytochrome c [Deinococcus radiopugnans]
MGDYSSAPSKGFVWGAVIATLIVVAVLAFIFKVVTPAGPAASAPEQTRATPAASAPASPTAPATDTAADAPVGTDTPSADTEAAATTASAADQPQAGSDTPTTAPDQDRADEGGTAQAAASEETQMAQVAFTGENGAALYVQACQSCHMPEGRGAKGAGQYPALANNERATSTPYVTSLILNGNGGMPSFGHYLNDEQIAQIVNYVRGDLNGQDSDVKPQEIKQLRPENPDYLIFGESAG